MNPSLQGRAATGTRSAGGPLLVRTDHDAAAPRAEPPGPLGLSPPAPRTPHDSEAIAHAVLLSGEAGDAG